jgi:hypothetical protein
MPIFTVTVKDEKTGSTKTVTVNTDNMEAAIVPAVTSMTEPDVKQQADVHQDDIKVNIGGKRSTSSFRLKKRRITRKIRKTR